MVDEEQVDMEKAARQSTILAQVMFGVVVLVMFGCAMFGTWAYFLGRDTVPWPPFLLLASSIVLWIGLVAVIYRGWQGNQRRKRLENR